MLDAEVISAGNLAVFRDTILLNAQLEPVSANACLQDRVVLLYFAAGRLEACRSFTCLLRRFHEVLANKGGDVPVVIFVSHDDNKEEQLQFFQEGGMHPEWLCASWSNDLRERGLNADHIPAVIVLDTEGRAVVTDVYAQISQDCTFQDSATFENAVIQKWYGWRHVASAERVIEGDVMRSGFSAQVPEHMEGSSSSSCGPPSSFTAPWVGSPSASVAENGFDSSVFRDVARIREARAGHDAEFGSDVASNGGSDYGELGGHVARDAEVDRMIPNPEEAVASLTAMGFDEAAARSALEAANGDVDAAVALIVG